MKELMIMGLKGQKYFKIDKDSLVVEIFLISPDHERKMKQFLETATIAIRGTDGKVLITRMRDMSVPPVLEITSKYLSPSVATIKMKLK